LLKTPTINTQIPVLIFQNVSDTTDTELHNITRKCNKVNEIQHLINYFVTLILIVPLKLQLLKTPDNSFVEHANSFSAFSVEHANSVPAFLKRLAITSVIELNCWSLTLLYDRTASLVWPVFSLISCSSTLAANNRVAADARSEWFEKNPVKPAAAHSLLTTAPNVLIPIACLQYQRSSVYLSNGLR
jgi:hypothetical protein